MLCDILETLHQEFRQKQWFLIAIVMSFLYFQFSLIFNTGNKPRQYFVINKLSAAETVLLLMVNLEAVFFLFSPFLNHKFQTKVMCPLPLVLCGFFCLNDCALFTCLSLRAAMQPEHPQIHHEEERWPTRLKWHQEELAVCGCERRVSGRWHVDFRRKINCRCLISKTVGNLSNNFVKIVGSLPQVEPSIYFFLN